MKAVALLVLLGLALVAAYSESEYQAAFTSWTQKFSRSYSAAEFRTRYNIFKTNMDYVRDWNAGNSKTVLGLNNFADISNAEYQRIYLGTKVDARNNNAHSPAINVRDNYNATVDWRTKNVITPIKNQGQCGACWAFSTTGSVEAAHALSTSNLVSLSEQNLMDCSTAYGNEGCDGGLMDQAFAYIIKNGGIDTEASYPYLAGAGTCHYTSANSGATISSYKDVTKGSETALAAAVTITPVSVAIDASGISFQLYHSGIYHDPLCSSTKLDHGVLAVGYGTDTSNSENYWIVKNSWGTTWGMEGWIYMSKDRNNNCGIATAASYPIV